MFENIHYSSSSGVSLDRLQQQAKTQDSRKARQAAENFEAIFVNMLFSSLRKSMTTDGFFGSGLQGELFQGMMEQKLSEVIAKRHQFGIADLIEKQIKNSYASQPSQNSPIISPEQRQTLIKRAQKASGLPAELISAVIEQESGWNPNATSPRGARGLMQLMEDTAGDLGVANIFDPEENILAGARYLKKLIKQFDNLPLALAAYNAGPSMVLKYKGIPPFAETQNYVRNILNKLRSQ